MKKRNTLFFGGIIISLLFFGNLNFNEIYTFDKIFNFLKAETSKIKFTSFNPIENAGFSAAATSLGTGTIDQDLIVGTANPAAVYCDSLGYSYELRGSEGYCVFEFGECPEWPFYHGTCAPEKNYCGQNGYETLTKHDGDALSKDYAVCVKDGKEVGRVSKLADIEKKAVKSESIQSIEAFPATETVTTAPSSFDWRNYNGQNWITSVKNQASCGSCWAFGALGNVEAMHNIRNNNPDLDLDLSEEEMVSDCLSPSNTCCGGFSSQALSYVRDYGISSESCKPYISNTCSCPSTCSASCTYNTDGLCSNSACSRCTDDLTYIDEWAYLPSYDLAAMKESISTKGPLTKPAASPNACHWGRIAA